VHTRSWTESLQWFCVEPGSRPHRAGIRAIAAVSRTQESGPLSYWGILDVIDGLDVDYEVLTLREAQYVVGRTGWGGHSLIALADLYPRLGPCPMPGRHLCVRPADYPVDRDGVSTGDVFISAALYSGSGGSTR
jgi:hypothetical protein